MIGINRLVSLGVTFCRSRSVSTLVNSSSFATTRSSLFQKDFSCNRRSFQTSSFTCCSTKKPSDKNASDSDDDGVTAYLSTKYKILSEDNAPLILDLELERKKAADESTQEETFEKTQKQEEEEEDEFSRFDLTRGVRGVYDIEQLVDVLHSEGAIDLFVCKIPEELCYADHIAIITGRSVRHRIALAQLVRRVYKRKRNTNDIVPRIEGEADSGKAEWLAMDLGNIILHIFARNAREKYDLESLWSLGSKHDVQSNQKNDELLDLLASSELYLEDLEPAEPTISSKEK
ncbi:uncharacterized protein LOC132202201 [Neocloeon triangulifer]|uniref:uncharacterized protein LOC132202201 n=1 Tax=Neocloeon triangulifer TaxID=2078957 RepID=UPI00286F13E8|nr:uncharacterized protein LOC132202201 [Neocloeon triangulifer]XP_059484953.1 uncharacterized protein LOC132202201 [Neocloeon triangulifer]